MELPVVSNKPHDDPGTLVRAIKKANAEICAANGQEAALASGRAFHHPDQPEIWDANAVYELHQPNSMTADDVITELLEHYAGLEITCRICVPNDEDVAPDLQEALNGHGYLRRSVLCMRLEGIRADHASADGGDLQIISARAMRSSYRTFRHEVHRADWGELAAANMADYQINALDESRLDMFVARRAGRLVAAGGVYSAGEIGILWDIATHPDHRRQGIMRAFMPRLLEHCARSQFKSVVLETSPKNTAATRLYESFGFARLSEFPVYRNTPERND